MKLKKRRNKKSINNFCNEVYDKLKDEAKNSIEVLEHNGYTHEQVGAFILNVLCKVYEIIEDEDRFFHMNLDIMLEHNFDASCLDSDSILDIRLKMRLVRESLADMLGDSSANSIIFSTMLYQDLKDYIELPPRSKFKEALGKALLEYAKTRKEEIA